MADARSRSAQEARGRGPDPRARPLAGSVRAVRSTWTVWSSPGWSPMRSGGSASTSCEPGRLDRLAAIRDRYGGRDPYLDAFLDCLLDKHEGRYWNRTYLSLPVLEVILDEHDLMPIRAGRAAGRRHRPLRAVRGAPAQGRRRRWDAPTRGRCGPGCATRLRFMTLPPRRLGVRGTGRRHRARARGGPRRPSWLSCRRRRWRSQASGSS